MKKFLTLLLILSIMKPVFNTEEAKPAAEDGADKVAPAEDADAAPADAAPADADADAAPAEDADPAPADDADADAAPADEDAAPSNRFWFRHYNEDYYSHGFAGHYGQYGCCDMNFHGRRACCYNRPWSSCCPNSGFYGFNSGLQYDGSAPVVVADDDHHHAPLVLKTQHNHFDSPILSSSRSTVSIGY